jgi:hypothetical protein
VLEKRAICVVATLLGALAIAAPARGATIDTANFPDYTVRDVTLVNGAGTLFVSDILYGGISLQATFSNGVLTYDPNTLLLVGPKGSSDQSGKLVSIGVTRDAAGHIVSLAGTEKQILSGFQGLQSGLAFFGDNLLFTSSNTQSTPPTSSVFAYLNNPPANANRNENPLTLPGADVLDGLALVPPGFPGSAAPTNVRFDAGTDWFSATVTPNPNPALGAVVTGSQVAGISFAGVLTQPSGIGYLGPQRDFAAQSVLIGDHASGTVFDFAIDANGNPITSSGKRLLFGMTGPNGIFQDPFTGDILIAGGTLTSPEIAEVQAAIVVPEPGPAAALALGLGLALSAARRRRGGRRRTA